MKTTTGGSTKKRATAVIGVLRWTASAALDAICLPTCRLCGTSEMAVGGEVLCQACSEAVLKSCHDTSCPRCGHTVPPFSSTESGCIQCPPKRPPYDRVIRVGTYDGSFRSLFLRFKYGGAEELDTYFATALARRIARSEVYEGIDALVAVPVFWANRLARRVHPAPLLTQHISARLRIPSAPLLLRTSGGPHQAGLPLTSRQRNVRGKFRLARGCSVDGANLCLIDDVMTSGSTVAECARILKRSGAREVTVGVVARAADDAASLSRR